MTTPPQSTHPAQTPTAGNAVESRLPRSFFAAADGTVTRDLALRELSSALTVQAGTLWVDIDTSVRQQMAILEKLFGFHPLSIEDVLNPNSRAKVEQYEGYLFVIIRVVSYGYQTEDPYDLETANLCVFIGPNYVVTAHAGPSANVEAVVQLTTRTPEVMQRGAARIAHQVMDGAVDQFFPILDRVDDFSESLEERVFKQFDEEALLDIFAVKRMVLTLRRHLAPEREIFNVLTNRPSPLLSPEVQIYFRDIYDHILRINDSLDTYRDLLSTTLESYLSQVSNRLGLVTKGLTVVATLSVPFVVVSGMWGMNFDRIPLKDVPHGFELMLALQLGFGLVLIWVLRKRGWL